MFVCSRIPKTTCPNFTKFSVHANLWSWLGPVTTVQCYVLLVMWIMSYFHIMVPLEQNRTTLCFVEFARWRYWGRSLMSAITLFIC